MTVFEELRSALREKYDTGMTQKEIADRTGISQSHICKLLNGSRSFSEVTLGNVLKLFPQAKLILIPYASDALDAKISELSRELSQNQKLELIVELSRMTAAKSTPLETMPNQKIG